ncbi:hypothetical protein [Alistipes finegoldii]|uniref:hypothetical protein n=1 Tax=Alistipes finegoldii TaxID=214856 RepID=UPI0024B20479|nr:hypothetical protein [Alistipes finegoldii]
MKEESKSWQRFEGKIRSLKQYLQLMDLALTISNKQCFRQDYNISIALALGTSTDSHRQLNIPNKKTDIKRTFVSARNQLNEQAFVELQCIFSGYISNVIAEIAHGSPNKLLGILGNDSTRSINFSDIIKLGSYENVISEMAHRVFRILENMRSTKDMIKKLCHITQISIPEDLMSDSLVYIDVRHLIIHRDSCADEVFLKKDVKKLIPTKDKKNRILLKYSITNKAITTIYAFCRTMDKQLIEKKVLPIRKQ